MQIFILEMEASSSRTRSLAAADDLNLTVLRHQVERYFNELQQEADTQLNMDFLGIKKHRPAVSSTSRPQPGSSFQLCTPAAAESYLKKKFHFDNTATGEMSSMSQFNSSLFSSSYCRDQESLPTAMSANSQRSRLKLWPSSRSSWKWR